MSAPVWNRTSISCASGRRHHQIGFESKIVAGDHQRSVVCCPATGIVNYLIVKDHPRPSPEWLPRFIEGSESFGIRIDLSRSRRPALSAGSRVIGPRNEKSRRGFHQGGLRKNL